jgi:hypothetical protein
MRFDAPPPLPPLSLLLLLLLHACLPAGLPASRSVLPSHVVLLVSLPIRFPSLLLHHLLSAGRKQKKKFIIISLA